MTASRRRRLAPHGLATLCALVICHRRLLLHCANMKESRRILSSIDPHYTPLFTYHSTLLLLLLSSCNNAKRVEARRETRRDTRRGLMSNLLGSICRCCELLAHTHTHKQLSQHVSCLCASASFCWFFSCRIWPYCATHL